MNSFKKKFDNLAPKFEKGKPMHWAKSLYEGFGTFLFVPTETSRRGVHIHDSIDMKRAMITVVLALIPCALFGMYNLGYQHFLVTGQLVEYGFWSRLWYGFLAFLPRFLVSYIVGLAIEFADAQIKDEEISEGYLVTGFLIPLIVPWSVPLWMLALAIVFSVIFAKVVFGGSGYNTFNVALVTRAFLFFSYPSKMSGDVWVPTGRALGFGGSDQVVDGFTGATPLGQVATWTEETAGTLTTALGQPLTSWDMISGLMPGSIGETSIIAIAIGALILLCTGIASWKIMVATFGGGFLTALMFNAIGATPAMTLPAWSHLMLGGFAFGAVFMATDPVTASRTETGKWIYGFLIGFFAISVRVLNPGYPEGMMLSILLMNALAPLIDYFVVEANVSRRTKRADKAAAAHAEAISK